MVGGLTISENLENRRFLALGYSKIGEVEKALGHLKEAAEYYGRGLIIREELAEETQTPEARRALFASYASLGRLESIRSSG